LRESTKLKISVVIPCFQAESSIEELCDRLKKSLSKITTTYEVILVDDGSTDNSWQIISTLSESEPSIKGLKLSRNFGQHNAITAGLEKSSGDWVVVMDCDLQDQPEEISNFWSKSQEGYQVVVGIRNTRQDNLLKRLSSLAFYAVFQKLTNSRFNKRIGNFGIYSKKVVKSVLELREQHRSFGLLVFWVGFKRAEIGIQHVNRGHGKSNYRLKHRIALAIDSIVSHSNNLLYGAIKLGVLTSFTSLLVGTFFAFRYLLYGITTQGWTSLVISIYFTSGFLLAGIGLLGIYVGKIFNETKARPIYIIEAETNDN
jgi:dolichol-phosphate mannosyltransferase